LGQGRQGREVKLLAKALEAALAGFFAKKAISSVLADDASQSLLARAPDAPAMGEYLHALGKPRFAGEDQPPAGFHLAQAAILAWGEDAVAAKSGNFDKRPESLQKRLARLSFGR
jgi:hypothetical protein